MTNPVLSVSVCLSVCLCVCRLRVKDSIRAMQKDHHFPSCAISRRQLRIWYIINQGFTLDPLYPKRRCHFYSCAVEVPFPVCYESWLLFMAFKRCTCAPLLPLWLFSNLDSPFLQWLYVVRGFRISAPSPSPRGVLFQKRILSNKTVLSCLSFFVSVGVFWVKRRENKARAILLCSFFSKILSWRSNLIQGPGGIEFIMANTPVWEASESNRSPWPTSLPGVGWVVETIGPCSCPWKRYLPTTWRPNPFFWIHELCHIGVWVQASQCVSSFPTEAGEQDQ